jgi:hypothetical protein
VSLSRPKTCFSAYTRASLNAPYMHVTRRSVQSVLRHALCLGIAALVPAAVQADPPVLGGGAVSAVSTPLDGIDGQYTDVVFGRNVKGPYLLSWKAIRPGSEVVTRDGVVLKRDTDYTFDPLSGSISFPNPVSPSQLVRVAYAADTVDSKPNSSTLGLPLQWTLWSQNKNKLTFNSLYKPDPLGTNSSTALASNLQFLDSTNLTHSSVVTSGLFMDLHGGDWMGRSGARFAEDTKWRNADVGASYSYAGALFNQGDATGLKAGKEILQANGTFTPLTNLKVTTLVRQTNELLDVTKLLPGAPTRGKETMETVQSLSLALPQRGKVDASRAVTTVTDANGDSVTTTTDAVKVQRQIVQGTQATVGYEAQTIIPTSRIQGEEPAQGTYTQKTSIEIKSTPAKQFSITGTFRNAIGGANAGDSDSLHIEATPIASLKQFKVTTGFEDIYQDTGVQRKREALVDLPTVPLVKTQISGGVQQLDNAGKQQFIGIVSAKSSPFRYVQLDGGAKLRQGTLADNVTPDPDVVNTYNCKFTIAPSRFLKLTGNVAHNPEGDGGAVKRLLSQSVGLESDWKLFLFKAQYGTENDYQTAKLNSLLNLGVDLRLTKFDILSTGFEGRSAFDTNLTSTMTYKLGFTHKLGTALDLNLTGTYTQNTLNGIPTSDRPELKAEAKVGVHF